MRINAASIEGDGNLQQIHYDEQSCISLNSCAARTVKGALVYNSTNVVNGTHGHGNQLIKRFRWLPLASFHGSTQRCLMTLLYLSIGSICSGRALLNASSLSQASLFYHFRRCRPWITSHRSRQSTADCRLPLHSAVLGECPCHGEIVRSGRRWGWLEERDHIFIHIPRSTGMAPMAHLASRPWDVLRCQKAVALLLERHH